jgi:orotate phosphoribosyltransferase-like protein
VKLSKAVELFGMGMSVREVAEELKISKSTDFDNPVWPTCDT